MKNQKCIICKQDSVKIRRLIGIKDGKPQYGEIEEICGNKKCFSYLSMEKVKNWVKR